MSEEQREQLQVAYDSLQSNYKTLLDNYEGGSDTLPSELKSLYSQMQTMHRQMDANHRQMMGGNMGNHMGGNEMMGQGMGRHMKGNGMMNEGMRMHMQGRMTGEWYSQMMGMHKQMAQMHQRMGQQNMARRNRRLSEEYGKMRKMIPNLDEPDKLLFNGEGDPRLLNGESLFSQNCASCHGGNAEGVSGAFPPLVNSEWVTGNKSIPIRILLHGLQGEIEVQGQTYQGVMPSFKARLSGAEVAALLTYLREKSDGDYPTVSQQDVVEVAHSFSNRTAPWSASELNKN